MGINDVRVPDEHRSMQVINRFVAAYNSYDIDAMLGLQTDDVTWTWIDPGKNFPVFSQRVRSSAQVNRRYASCSTWTEASLGSTDTYSSLNCKEMR